MSAATTSLSEIIYLDKITYALARFSASNFTLFYWEFIITFGDEVEHIWKRKKSAVSILYLFNRYFLIIGYVLLSLALWNPLWVGTGTICEHFVKFEGSMTITVILVSEILMTLRTYALYGHNKFVLLGLVTIMIGQLIYSAIIVHGGSPAALPPPITGCILGGDPALGKWAETLGLIPLIFDSSVLALTVARTLKINRGVPTMQILLRDGIIYFFVIFSSNFSWVMMNFFAPAVYQQTLSSFCTIITVIMVNRLTINLRTSADTPTSSMRYPMNNSGSRTAGGLPSADRDKDIGVASFPMDSFRSDTMVSHDFTSPVVTIGSVGTAV